MWCHSDCDHVDQRDRGCANHYGLRLSPITLWSLLSILWSEGSPRINQTEEGSAELLGELSSQFYFISFTSDLTKWFSSYNFIALPRIQSILGKWIRRNSSIDVMKFSLAVFLEASYTYNQYKISHVIILLIKNLQKIPVMIDLSPYLFGGKFAILL